MSRPWWPRPNCRPQSIASDLWNHGNLKATTNVVRASNNLEVAVVLDITGSMSGDMDSLRSAATKLVDIVVQDVQTPYYSKLAIVPYSNAVNVGSNLIDDVRGAMRDAAEIQGADRSRPVFIDADAHGFDDDELIYIDGVRGMTELNGNTYEVDDATTNTFTLKHHLGKQCRRPLLRQVQVRQRPQGALHRLRLRLLPLPQRQRLHQDVQGQHHLRDRAHRQPQV